LSAYSGFCQFVSLQFQHLFSFRRLIINNNIHVGTQLPYIEKAKKAGYSVIVLNTNDNKRKAKEIEGSETPIKHAISAWKQYISMVGRLLSY
jgi:hypothetical protein